ncbi:MAG TPA: hypothetical protein VK988_16015, partial [Acidimicrobiales bacterium]|nr:hypothetical protein [Acidimicrobiales bacterium]
MRFRTAVAVALLGANALFTPTALARSTPADSAGEPTPEVLRPTPFDEEQAAEAGRQSLSGERRSSAGSASDPASQGTRTAAASPSQAGLVTFRVFATQYQPTVPGSVELAVPDKCVKFAARRDSTNLSRFGCAPGYRLDLDYRVMVTRDSGQRAAIPATEVGPWNVDDNYWAEPGSPRPRRRFADLPRGTPEAQAAFQQDYNAMPCKNLNGSPSGRTDGADQFSRCVLNPGGIDLSVEAAARLGLRYAQNEWVTVSFLWEPAASGWEPLGGHLTSGPAVASWGENRLDTFVRGPDNALWHKAWDGWGWTPW